MDRTRLGRYLSIGLLTIAMLAWSDYFLFAKTVPSPIWARWLPPLLSGTEPLIVLALLPATLLPPGLKPSAKALLVTTLLAPIAAAIAYAAARFHQPAAQLAWNTLFQYGWMAFQCAVIAAIVFGARALLTGLWRLIDRSERNNV